MKIRTDFVTNSSSYCTAEVIIDNPVLLEILQKYKDKGLFGDRKPIFGIGEYETVDEYWDEYERSRYDNKTKTPALFYYEHQSDDDLYHAGICDWIWPKTLDEVIVKIIEIISGSSEYLNNEIQNALVEELNQRKTEIDSAYTSVYWASSGDGEDTSYEVKYSYDPKVGSTYEHEGMKYLGDFGEDDIEGDNNE